MFVGTGTIGGRGASGRCSHAERGNNIGNDAPKGPLFPCRVAEKA